jgi:hypothetical protein
MGKTHKTGAHDSGRKRTGGGKMDKVMHEFAEGALHSGSKKGPVVTDRAQAIAIGISEEAASKKKHPRKKATGKKR